MPLSNEDFHWVPKIHPLDRFAESEDPLELMAEPVMGDPAEMLAGLLQEFAWLGFSAEQLVSLFSNPAYPMLCELRAYFGDEEIFRQVQALVQSWGQLRFRETISETEDDRVEVVQISLGHQAEAHAPQEEYPETD